MLSLEEAATLAASRIAAIHEESAYAAEMDAGFDAGEFSKPWHAENAQEKCDAAVASLAEEHSLPISELEAAINRILNSWEQEP